MKKNGLSFGPAHIVGIGVCVAAAGFFPRCPVLSVVLLSFYVASVIVACFFPQMQFLGPVISRGKTGKPWVSLTFDDGPSAVTRGVLDLLDRHQVPATFFVSGVNASRYPDIMADIIARGHDVGNHSLNHFPFLMMKSRRFLYREIAGARDVLSSMGIDAMAFRPPVGIINPKLFGILDTLDMFCVTFSCRAVDFGNRRTENLAFRILKRVKADDIILMHDVPAHDVANEQKLLQEIESVIAGIKNKGLKVVPLGDLIGRQVMTGRGR